MEMRLLDNIHETIDVTRATTRKVVKEYREKIERISGILEETPEIVKTLHRDLANNLSESRGGRKSTYTSAQVLRALIVMFVEGLDYRGTVVQIENSEFLRRFVGLGVQTTMDFTFLSKAFCVIQENSWKVICDLLADFAKATGKISGEKLRIDTTAYESNIHYPTDASLLWDGFRTMARLLRLLKEEFPELCGRYRFHDKKVKKLMLYITRNSKSKKKSTRRKVNKSYQNLIEQVNRVVAVSIDTCGVLPPKNPTVEELTHYIPLVGRVVDQAVRRVFEGEKVPSDEKPYSIFEEHTELLIRGKANKEIEFGHMVLIGQSEEKFITQYEVMRHRVADKDLVDDILASHHELFGKVPDVFAADKGFYESMEKIEELEEEIETVSLCKKGRRNAEEEEREHGEAFRDGQRFRAGVEGTISVLKRAFKMLRCYFKGYNNYASSVGCAVFCHNLVLLTRS
jgi:transposase, IS5 family